MKFLKAVTPYLKCKCNGKGRTIRIEPWIDPEGSRKLRLPEFLDNQHMKGVRLSALGTGRLYHQEIFLLCISDTGRVDPRGIVRPEGYRQ
jgi:hypothetical protein